MPFALLKLAEDEGVQVEYWAFKPPIEAVYLRCPELPPVIGLKHSLVLSRTRFRCILAEELGHHFTTPPGTTISRCFHYQDRVRVSRAEYRAMRWAAEWLMPADKLAEAITHGVSGIPELADYFQVTEEMASLRLDLLGIQGGS